MDATFVNSENSKTSDVHRLLVNISDKIDLKRIDKCVALSNLNIYSRWKNIRKSYKKNKFKKPAPTWNEKFEISNGSKSVSDITEYFEYIIKKHSRVTDNRPIKTEARQLYVEREVHFMKVEKWFLMILKVEYFHKNQLKVGVI